jgi:hypothetical protein
MQTAGSNDDTWERTAITPQPKKLSQVAVASVRLLNLRILRSNLF